MVSYPAPRLRMEIECDRRGRAALVAGCVDLLAGGEPRDTGLLIVLGGPHAEAVLADGLPDVHRYWLRVWAARGLLWVWDDSATGAVRGALTDGAWRVREMAAKVVARHAVGDALPEVVALRDDPVQRVRAAASRAVAVLTAAGA